MSYLPYQKLKCYLLADAFSVHVILRSAAVVLVDSAYLLFSRIPKFYATKKKGKQNTKLKQLHRIVCINKMYKSQCMVILTHVLFISKNKQLNCWESLMHSQKRQNENGTKCSRCIFY